MYLHFESQLHFVLQCGKIYFHEPFDKRIFKNKIIMSSSEGAEESIANDARQLSELEECHIIDSRLLRACRFWAVATNCDISKQVFKVGVCYFNHKLLVNFFVIDVYYQLFCLINLIWRRNGREDICLRYLN